MDSNENEELLMLYDMFTAEGTHMQKDEVKYAYEYLGFEKALNRLQ